MAVIDVPNDLETLKQQIDLSRLPQHVAIIMDGNGRWAHERGRPRLYGHNEGYKTVQRIVRDAGNIGLRVLTLYVFSVENWKRPHLETTSLMQLIENAARQQLPALKENNVKIRFIGRRAGLPASLQREMDRDMDETRDNTGLTLNLAINYGGRAEIADAVLRIAQSVAAGEIDPDAVTEDLISAHLYAPDLPDPDLLIRTAGELRVSNFLLWGVAYAELWVTQTLWPDFTASHLVEAIHSYQGRVRKFGTVVNT